ncbi:MAG: hypothetical protein HZA04_07445 [Nitrospinae bacterium]|nr:hypothetical protein [Nitrospinota bacterium]
MNPEKTNPEKATTTPATNLYNFIMSNRIFSDYVLLKMIPLRGRLQSDIATLNAQWGGLGRTDSPMLASNAVEAGKKYLNDCLEKMKECVSECWNQVDDKKAMEKEACRIMESWVKGAIEIAKDKAVTPE